MSSSEITLYSCSCHCRHNCKRNFGTQFPEVPYEEWLRYIDLIKVPKPFITISRAESQDFSSQVTPLDFLPVDKSLDVQGSSLYDIELDLDEVIKKHIVFKQVTKNRKSKYPSKWIQQP